MRYDEETPPDVSIVNDKIFAKVGDPILNTILEIEPDYLVLSNGITPSIKENQGIAKLYKVPLNEDGFFLEAHVKLRPVDFATEGIFLAGLAHSPKFVDESIAQAKAAAGRAAIILAKVNIITAGTIANVNLSKCIGCGLCADVCIYSAVSLVEKKIIGKVKKVAEVNPALCKGCGTCTATCRPNAIDLYGFSNQEVTDAVYGIIAERRKVDDLNGAESLVRGF